MLLEMSTRSQVVTDIKTRSKYIIADLICLEGLCDFFNSWRFMWSPIKNSWGQGQPNIKSEYYHPVKYRLRTSKLLSDPKHLTWIFHLAGFSIIKFDFWTKTLEFLRRWKWKWKYFLEKVKQKWTKISLPLWLTKIVLEDWRYKFLQEYAEINQRA